MVHSGRTSPCDAGKERTPRLEHISVGQMLCSSTLSVAVTRNPHVSLNSTDAILQPDNSDVKVPKAVSWRLVGGTWRGSGKAVTRDLLRRKCAVHITLVAFGKPYTFQLAAACSNRAEQGQFGRRLFPCWPSNCGAPCMDSYLSYW